MALSLSPAKLKRYKDVARLLYKYGRSDLVTRAGLDTALEEEPFRPPAAADPKELARQYGYE